MKIYNKIKNIATGVIYRNPKPHLRSQHAYFPSVVQFKSKEMLAAFQIGSAFESIDGRTETTRSTDGGKTWSMEGGLPGETTDIFSSALCRISQMPDGEIIAFGGRFDRSDPEQGLMNPETMGFVDTELILFRSRDEGHTWEGPEVIKPPFSETPLEICSPIVPLKDGRWLIPTSTWKGWNGENHLGMKAIALVSHNRGKSWPEYIDVMDGTKEDIACWEQKIIELENGRLLSVAWAHNLRTQQDLPNQYAISDDGGRSFPPPRSSGLQGQTPMPILLINGKILCVYRRNDKPGLWAQLARLEGSDWINETEAPVWSGNFNLFTRRENRESMTEEFAALKFGAPILLMLPNNEIFVTYWCVENCVSIIRWNRLKIGG